MAAAWSLYLSFGVILIFSNCACTEVTSGAEAAKKNDTSNRTTDRNVWSVSTKAKHPSTPNPPKANALSTSSDGLKMVASENATKGISASTVDTRLKNVTAEVRRQITSDEGRSSVSRAGNAVAYTTPSISRSKENRTKGDARKDEKENLYIGFRNLFDGFKNVRKPDSESMKNQFPDRSVLPTTPTYHLNKDTRTRNARTIVVLPTLQSVANNSTTSVVVGIASTLGPPTTVTDVKAFASTSSSRPTVTTATPVPKSMESRPSSTAAIPTFPKSVPSRSNVTRVRDLNELAKTTVQPENSTFDINSLRKKFVFIGNLTAANGTTEKAFLSVYDKSTVSVDTTPSRPFTKSANSTKYTASTNSTKSTASTKKPETSTIYDLTFMDEAAEFPQTETPVDLAGNSTASQTSPVGVTIRTTSSATNSTPTLWYSRTTPTPMKKFSANKTVAHENHVINKEHLQFPGITLKVSHVLIPKQKRSRYNIRDMKIELPKSQLLGPPSAPKPKNSNCTRFPVQVVTASDTESKEKVNLTEEHYDCEYSPEPNTTQKEPAAVPLHTYFGGYVFRYTLPKVPANVSATNQTANHTSRSTSAPGTEDTDDYYSSYMEYSDPTNGSSSSGVEDGIFPDPDLSKTISETKSEALSIPLPDTSLTDSDLHDHDVIDSVMYIYFGGTTHGQRGAGRQIIIVGAVIALVAQFLTLASSIRRIKTHKGEEPTIILLNIETALTLTNLIFILGVQSTSDHTICKVIAASLYYLHIATLFWFLLSSVHSLQTVCQFKTPFKIHTYCVFGWITPFMAALLSYVFNERSFETNLYCWVSPLRGILISYILPVILLCIICIVLTVIGLKNVTDTTEDFDDTYSHKKLLRISAVALPLFSVIWFTGMVSLENSASLLFSLIFLISDTILNWLLFACWLPSEASQWKDMDEDYYDEEEDFDDEPVLVKRRFDDQPLLSELYEYGAQGQLYNLRVEPISIIST